MADTEDDEGGLEEEKEEDILVLRVSVSQSNTVRLVIDTADLLMRCSGNLGLL